MSGRSVIEPAEGEPMPAWPGGPCPQCGEEMPPALVRCRTCRALLNPDLECDSVEIPEFVPLPEIAAMIEVEPAGFFILCPNCRQELRINRKYSGQRVQCKHCSAPFIFDPSVSVPDVTAFYAECPYCQQELRAAHKYLGAKVACKHCGGHIHFVEQATT